MIAAKICKSSIIHSLKTSAEAVDKAGGPHISKIRICSVLRVYLYCAFNINSKIV